MSGEQPHEHVDAHLLRASQHLKEAVTLDWGLNLLQARVTRERVPHTHTHKSPGGAGGGMLSRMVVGVEEEEKGVVEEEDTMRSSVTTRV